MFNSIKYNPLNLNSFRFKPNKSLFTVSTLIIASYTTMNINDDFYYFFTGLKRAIYTLSAGIQIIAFYYIKGVNDYSHEYASKKLYTVCKKNSGSYIKLGQGLVQMEHILPQQFIENLEPLCQEAPITEFHIVKKLIEKEFKNKLEDIFSEFDHTPIGSASIAQVHKAVLKTSNQKVAVKVQHPMVSKYCPSDVAIVKFATKVGEILWPGSKLQWIAWEFERNIMKEIDLTNEGKNADRIRNLFKNDIRVVIPEIKWTYTTKKILTMSFEEGKSIIDTEYRITNKIYVNEIAELLSDVFNRQIFEFGFVHSDPHHGNLFIRKELINGRKITRLVLLDHGLYRELDDNFKFNFSLLWRGIFLQKEDVIMRACRELNVTNPEIFVSIVTNRSYRDIMNTDDKYSTTKRLGDKIQSESEKKRLKKFISDNLKNLTLTLNDMRSEMILVLKINGFLRCIDRRIGNPINNFNIMIKYVYKELIISNKANERFKLYLEYISFRFIMVLLNLYFSIFNNMFSDKRSEYVNLDIEN